MNDRSVYGHKKSDRPKVGASLGDVQEHVECDANTLMRYTTLQHQDS